MFDRNLGSLLQKAEKYIRLTGEEEAFTEANRQYWGSVKAADGTLLVDASLKHPGYVMNAGEVAVYLARRMDLEPVFILRRGSRKYREVCESYGGADTLCLLNRYRPELVATAVRDAVVAYRRIDTPADVKALSYHGTTVGDLVYNTYIAREETGTIGRVSRDLLPYLFHTFLYYQYYRRLFDRLDTEAVVTAQTSYVRSGTLTRVATAADIDVYCRKFGPKQFTIRRVESTSEALELEQEPSSELFDWLWDEHREYASTRGEEILRERLSGGDSSYVRNAYSDGDQTGTENELFDDPAHNPDDPTVVIMSHVFVDAGCFYGSLYRDYLVWLRETVHHCDSVPSVNWYVKPHPHTDAYDCRWSAEDVVRANTTEQSRVGLLPERIGTGSLHGLADAVVTVRGTAGIEFPALGTPAIVAGDNYYSQFGFTHTPPTVEEYEDTLSNIASIDPTTRTQRDRARTMMYILYDLFQVPSTATPEIDRLKAEAGPNAWRQACELLAKTDDQPQMGRSFDRFVQREESHLLDLSALPESG